MIGSGKSCLSHALQAESGGIILSFGGYVRRESVGRGEGVDRNTLQRMGAELLDELGWEGFCTAALKTSGWPNSGGSLIIDGIRHREVVETLKLILLPLPFALVFVDIECTIRLERLRSRGVLGKKEALAVDSHSTEQQVPSELRAMSDLQLDGSLPLADNMRLIHKLGLY